MNKRLLKTAKTFKMLIQIGLFVLAVVLIYQCIPSRSRFDRHFEVSKPWQYDLLTAPMDFPIYKTESELKAERDSVRGYLVPYFSVNYDVSRQELDRLEHQDVFPDSVLGYRTFLIKVLNQVYGKGIISSEHYQQINHAGINKISVIDSNRVAREVRLSEIYTPITAYEYILSQSGDYSDKMVRQTNINRYLKSNLSAEKEKSDQALTSLYERISPTSGVVQAGQRIIDRGEIISYSTYKILNSLRIESDKEELPGRDVYIVTLGRWIILFGLMALLFIYLLQFRRNILNSYRNTLFILLMMVGMVLLVSLTIQFTKLSVYFVPLALLPIIVRTFFDSRTGLFVHIIVVLITSMMVANSFEFVILQVAAGMTAVSSLKHMNQRSQLIQTSSLIFVTYCVGYLGIALIETGSFSDVNWVMFGIMAVNCLLLLFAYGLIYIFEKLFGFLSDVTLVELASINSAMMLEFSEKAPGTFQHALQVANLAVEAAKKVNANVLLVRTGALYHDIGKMENPMLFIENQSPGLNPLSELPYEEAAKIVINHVSDGVKLAQKNGLPKQIIDMIEQHHAESMTRYFYNSFKNAYPDREVREEWFTYPGPRPSTKEAAIVMMADAIEAASRTLKDYNEETIDRLVENLINTQIADGSLKDAPITFRQVEIIKRVFKEKLKNIYHNRITYPELQEKVKGKQFKQKS